VVVAERLDEDGQAAARVEFVLDGSETRRGRGGRGERGEWEEGRGGGGQRLFAAVKDDDDTE